MTSEHQTQRILLGHLTSNGDCLYTTAIARQIKHDFPGCHLTWAISSLCSKIIEHNPWVDEIWELHTPSWAPLDVEKAWQDFEDEAIKRYEQGDFQYIFFTQIYPGNPHYFDGTVRPCVFRSYPGPMTVPLQPTLHLLDNEVAEVTDFVEKNTLRGYRHVVLFESSSKSKQSYVTPQFALDVAKIIVEKHSGEVAVILSSQQAVGSTPPGIIDASTLSLRQMAELTKYCTLLIGCSSGISTVVTSSWSKQIPMIQLLYASCGNFGSLAHDYLYFGQPDSHVLEMFDAGADKIVDCFESYLAQGWDKTRELYHQTPEIKFSFYTEFVQEHLLRKRDIHGFCVSIGVTAARYGWRPELTALLREVAGNHLGKERSAAVTDPDLLLKELTALTNGVFYFTGIKLASGENIPPQPYPSSLRPVTFPVPGSRPSPTMQDLSHVALGVYDLMDQQTTVRHLRNLVHHTSKTRLSCRFLGVRNAEPYRWALLSAEELAAGDCSMRFVHSKSAPDSKQFVNAVADWAAGNGKTWMAITDGNSFPHPELLEELARQLSSHPGPVVLGSRVFHHIGNDAFSMSDSSPDQPRAITMPVSWWKKNAHRFRSYKLKDPRWIKLYAARVLQSPSSRYLYSPGTSELQLITPGNEAPRPEKWTRRLLPIINGDAFPAARWYWFQKACANSKLATGFDAQNFDALVSHFFKRGFLKTALSKPRL